MHLGCGASSTRVLLLGHHRTLARGATQASRGGAIFLDAATATLNAVRLSYNRATQGGAVYARSPTSSNVIALTIGGISFIEYNRADAEGGGLMLNDTRTRISSTYVRYNAAGTHGGGLAALLTGSTVASNDGSIPMLGLLGDTFRDNQAAGNGGGVWAKDLRVFVSGSALRYNNGAEGGGLYGSGTRNDANSWLRLSGSAVSPNKSSTEQQWSQGCGAAASILCCFACSCCLIKASCTLTDTTRICLFCMHPILAAGV